MAEGRSGKEYRSIQSEERQLQDEQAVPVKWKTKKWMGTQEGGHLHHLLEPSSPSSSSSSPVSLRSSKSLSR